MSTPEGVSGFRKRLVAYRKHHRPLPGAPFYLVTDAADLGHSSGDASNRANRILEQSGPVAVLVIDTLARAMGGADENATGDMSVLVDNCGLIAEFLGCAIILVHHVGKDATKRPPRIICSQGCG